jgi:ketosteroid isomerase-like protein
LALLHFLPATGSAFPSTKQGVIGLDCRNVLPSTWAIFEGYSVPMRVATLLVVSIFVSILSATAQPTPEPTVQLPPELDRVLRDYEKGWTGRDAKALASLFTEDGFALPMGSPMVRGRAAIEKHYSGSGGPLTLRPVAYSMDGNTGFIIGAFKNNPDGPEVGKFVLALRKDKSGRWLIAADMDNPSMRPPRPPAPPAAPAPPSNP